MAQNPNFEYVVACNKLCGSGHYNMKKKLRIVTQKEYDKWFLRYNPELNKNNKQVSKHTKTKEDMIFAASSMIQLGAKNVFIKGGHLESKVVQDIFVNKNEIFIIKNKRITTRNTHGTGCTLSSAISTFFSCGKTLKRSCELATKYVHNSINSNLKFGKGRGPINHLRSVIVEKNFR